MPRGYLDEMLPVNSGILGQYISPVGPFREPMYAMVDNDTVAVTPISTRTRSNKPKKKKSNKPKNDGIIRNHDTVWDYKIQDGKLLTRRKSSDGKWYDITSNDEARNRIEQFTGRSINNKAKTQVKDTSINNNASTNNDTVPQQKGTLKNTTPRYRTIDTTLGAVSSTNDMGFVYPVENGLYYINPKTRAIAEAHGETDMLGEFIPKGPVRREFTEPYMTSNEYKKTVADFLQYGNPNANWLNYFIGNAIPGLGRSVRDAFDRNNLGDTNYINLMKMLGIDVFAKGNERYYPM